MKQYHRASPKTAHQCITIPEAYADAMAVSETAIVLWRDGAQSPPEINNSPAVRISDEQAVQRNVKSSKA
jgi:hypothetical protein